MIEQKKAVLFDLDGTLVDSMWMWKEIDHLYLNSMGKQVPPSIDREIEGMSFTETARYFKELFTIPESIEEIQDIWCSMARDKYSNEVPLKEGARELLDELVRRGIKIGICSSNSMELVRTVLQAHDIESYFHQVSTCCEVKRGKPSPDIYLKVADDLQVEPKDCIVFEDIPMGLLAGKRAGMQTCAIEDEFSRELEQEKRELADYYIHNYFEVLNGEYEEL